MHYRDAYEEMFRISTETASSLSCMIEQTKKPQAYKAIFDYCTKTKTLPAENIRCYSRSGIVHV
jgi:hypothetical protein